MQGGREIIGQPKHGDVRHAIGNVRASVEPRSLVGLLYVDNLSKRGTFVPEDLEVYAVIAAQAGLVIDRVMAKSEALRQGVQLSALERFLSPAISRKITTEAADICLGGESQRITLLLAGVRGFTTKAEKMKPREAVGVLTSFSCE
jgi:GAF domain-containing protein